MHGSRAGGQRVVATPVQRGFGARQPPAHQSQHFLPQCAQVYVCSDDGNRVTVFVSQAGEAAEAGKSTPAELLPTVGAMTLITFMQGKSFPHAKVPHKRNHKRDDLLYRIRIAPKFGRLALSAINCRDAQVFYNALLAEGLSQASADPPPVTPQARNSLRFFSLEVHVT